MTLFKGVIEVLSSPSRLQGDKLFCGQFVELCNQKSKQAVIVNVKMLAGTMATVIRKHQPVRTTAFSMSARVHHTSEKLLNN